jgi:hypothetical protein
MFNWGEVVTQLGGYALFLGVAGWLIRTGIAARLTQDLEVFKTKLKAGADTEIERLRNSLQMAALEHQVRFSKLHERRAEVIADVYGQLSDLAEQSRQFVYAVQSSRVAEKPAQTFDQYNALYKMNYDLVRFIQANKIYIPESACGGLEKCLSVMNIAVITTQVYSNAEMFQNRSKELTDAVITIVDEVPKLMKSLEFELRAILGET